LRPNLSGCDVRTPQPAQPNVRVPVLRLSFNRDDKAGRKSSDRPSQQPAILHSVRAGCIRPLKTLYALPNSLLHCPCPGQLRKWPISSNLRRWTRPVTAGLASKSLAVAKHSRRCRRGLVIWTRPGGKDGHAFMISIAKLRIKFAMRRAAAKRTRLAGITGSPGDVTGVKFDRTR
jgi:hypothetical protein